MHVEHFMTKDPIACESDDSVEDVARMMRDNGVGFVVVLKKGLVAGIVTDRQLTTRVLAEGLAAGAVRVEKVMTRDPATVTLDDTLFTVVDTLRSAGVVRRVPVVNDQDQLVGVVSISDIAVITQDLVEALLLEDTRHSLKEAKVATGGKAMLKEMRHPKPQSHARHGRDAPRPVTRRNPGAMRAAAR
jgi:CBS domain-containing protein